MISCGSIARHLTRNSVPENRGPKLELLRTITHRPPGRNRLRCLRLRLQEAVALLRDGLRSDAAYRRRRAGGIAPHGDGLRRTTALPPGSSRRNPLRSLRLTGERSSVLPCDRLPSPQPIAGSVRPSGVRRHADRSDSPRCRRDEPVRCP
jgi:hypothetical protein